MVQLSRRAARELQKGGASEVWARIMGLVTPEIIDLGQGYPDLAGSDVARKKASEVLLDESKPRLNQYSPVPGNVTLTHALAKFYSPKMGQEIIPGSNVVVAASGTEALYCAIMSIINPGDEVIIFEPYFPWYAPFVRLAGGEARIIELKAPKFELPIDELREIAAGPKVKAIIFNTPHNPTGHVATPEEIQALADVCIENDIALISDEVYESCIFDGHKHLRVGALPGMPERTVTIGSASKMFNLTGWRVGWALGPADWLGGFKALHSYITYCAPTPLQVGVADALENDTATELVVSKMFASNAHILGAALEALGVEVILPEGGYFLIADVAKTGKSDTEFVEWLVKTKGVAAVPMSVFYQDPPAGTTKRCTLVRFAICKQEDTIAKACERLRK
ncbi:hypothetical protein SARC_00359 [Sphaeroforma arctica JP610]|uniref:Aminotransferase class I/classII large domain-containing protein n=1 Tax=Sphaeroforma arctica JP610 TaxID=667725 RepID=A0A0L0GET3_9EUKA|nr:hypothetical protein SARC_00359 [Sphaeroforma arctica JP610]KNC87535.1 hypothetical protein SARC_00359 [Sphaeroforma arctica JP610]|eukprot:XP_014161437.1 hypothetical protein SARC_00359 [Sphaeroforma arctica JP610]